MSNPQDYFIFTEAYKCGKIARKALETFCQYHDMDVHVLGRPQDFKELKGLPEQVKLMDIGGDIELGIKYIEGHKGTAHIFAKAITRQYSPAKYVIHFDSDVIFRGECISDISKGLEAGFAIVGQRRPYKHNRNNDNVRHLADTVGTCFFGMNTETFGGYDFPTTCNMVQGFYNPLMHPTLDFFDPVTFVVANNGGVIHYLDHEDYGSCDGEGNWENSVGKLNTLMDCGNKFMHFAGVGSGQNFHENGVGNVPLTYADWAKGRYAIYMKAVYNEDIEGIQYDEEDYKLIRDYIEYAQH